MSLSRASSPLLPESLQVLERGWLSSNNIVFADDEVPTVIDTGYVTHADTTLSLLQQALKGRPLGRILNTHIHSDHAGGNAMLKAHHGCETWIPPGDAALVDTWDEDRLSYRRTGQQCPPFTYDALLQPHSMLNLGGEDWTVLPALGHDHAMVMLWCERLGILISADALWQKGFGVIFPELDGIPGVEPAYGLPVTWISPEDKAHALGLGYQVVDVPSVVATHLSKLVREHLGELFCHEDVSALLERLTALSPKLGAALEKAMQATLLLKVCRALLVEQVSLKDIVPVATTLLEHAETVKDPLLLAAEVRCTLRRQIVAGLCGTAPEMKGFNLSGDLENMLLGSLNQARQAGKVALDSFPIDPNLLSQLQTHMPIAREQMKQQAAPPLLLVMPQIRPLLARYARLFAPGLNVLSYNEIPENREVNVIGTLG